MNLLSEKEITKLSWSKPKRKGVYFLIWYDTVLYVGASFDCEHRIKTHKQQKIIRFNRSYIIDEKNIFELERMYIKKFKPLYNGKEPVFNIKRKSGKLTKKESEFFSSRLTLSDYKDLTKKYNDSFSYTTIMNIMKGKTRFNTGDPRKIYMLFDAINLVRQRVANDMKVINPEKL